MLIRHHHNQSLNPARSGFTLIELMIVIAIIAVLMSLSIVVMFNLTDQARQEATLTTVRKVNALLDQRSEAFDRSFKGTRRDNAVLATLNLLADPNGDGNHNDAIYGVRPEVVEVLAKKATFRYEFPQRMIERSTFDGGTAVPGVGAIPNMSDMVYRKIVVASVRQELITEGYAAPSAAQINARARAKWNGGSDTTNTANGTKQFTGHLAATESAEMLYFALIASGSFGSSAVDSDRFTNLEVADTDNDGLPEFIDSWGNPLRFYRWPTRLMDPFAPVPFAPVLTDPDDPTDVVVISGGTTVGQRAVSLQERQVAGMLLKGLPPSPAVLSNASLPRDLLLTDPDDPVGRLYSELERLNGLNGMPNFGVEFNEANYHTPDTYHVPLVVSAGPDGKLGLREPNDTDPANGIFGNLAQYAGTTAAAPAPSAIVIDELTDNISNRNRRTGGRR